MTTTTMMMTVTVVTTMTTMAEMITIAATMSDGDVAIDAVGEVGEDDGPLAIACFIPALSPEMAEVATRWICWGAAMVVTVGV